MSVLARGPVVCSATEPELACPPLSGAAMPDRASQFHASGGGAPRGLSALLIAFTTWGLMPLYLRELRAVPPGQIMTYRLVLCCGVVLGWLGLRGQLAAVRAALAHPGTRRRLALTSLL